MTPRYSLVVPIYNEAENLPALLRRATNVLARLGNAYEIILVDDGSTDATPSVIAAASERHPELRTLRHENNRGQAVALFDGLRAARGEFILTMDGDGQNDPQDFPLLLAPVESGQLDLACGWRVDRHDSCIRKLMSRIGNRVRRLILGDPLHDSGCQLRAMRRTVIAALFPVDLMQSFLPSMVAAAGFKVGEFPVRHHERIHGHAHFGLRQLWWRPAVALFKVRRQLRR